MSQPPFVAPSERNKHPILEQLREVLPEDARVFEIGSGWAQHAIHFCKAMPGLRWQPSEKANSLSDLTVQLKSAAVAGISDPLELNVLEDPWPEQEFDAAYSANTAHIMSWAAVTAMFTGVGAVLIKGGLFCLYGPFNMNGDFTSEGNRDFDDRLRSRNPDMGIRDIRALETLAGSHQMLLQQSISMPANNFLLVFQKSGDVK
jgi:cyclopropane fatty-acyl-phospholipid synthase-like methyltransferase